MTIRDNRRLQRIAFVLLMLIAIVVGVDIIARMPSSHRYDGDQPHRLATEVPTGTAQTDHHRIARNSYVRGGSERTVLQARAPNSSIGCPPIEPEVSGGEELP